MGHARRLLLVSAIAFVWASRPTLRCALGPSPAAAESVGSFHYRMPDGWAACADGKALCPADGGAARIVVRSPAGGADAATLARGEAKGDLVKDQATAFAGQEGHLIVSSSDKVVVAAIATTAGGGVVVTLTAPPAEVGAAVHAWIAVAEGGIIGDAPPAAADATPKPFTLKNGAADCTATMYVDGKRYEVPGGQTVALALVPGRHTVEWSERDGAQKSAAIDVPQATELAGGCVAGAAATPAATKEQPAKAPEQLAEGDDRKAIFAGARAAVMFYRTCWNLALGGATWGPPKSLDRLMLKLLAHRSAAGRKELVTYVGHLEKLQRAVASTAKDEAARTKLRRVAALLLLHAGQVSLPKACASPDDAADAAAKDAALDCVLGKLSNLGTDAVDTMNDKSLRLATVDAPAEGLLTQVAELAP